MTVEPLEHFLVASPDVLPLRHDFCCPGPRVAIYATRCRHFLSLFFFRRTKNLGIREATKDRSSASSKTREKKDVFVGCIWRSFQIATGFAQRCDVIGLQMLLWRMQTWTETQPESLVSADFSRRRSWTHKHTPAVPGVAVLAFLRLIFSLFVANKPAKSKLLASDSFSAC